MRQTLYVHRLPGRIRIEVPGLKNNKKLSEKIAGGLQNAPGVKRCSANPVTGKVLVEYDEQHLQHAGIILAIDSLLPEAVRAKPALNRNHAADGVDPEWPAIGNPAVHLALCGAAAGALLFGRRAGFPPSASSPVLQNAAAAVTVATTYPFFARGLRRFAERKRLNYDFLAGAAVLSLLALRQSVMGLAVSGLVNAVEFLRLYHLRKARLQIQAHSGLVPRTARLVDQEGEKPVFVHQLHPGDIVAVYAGEVVPVDGLIIAGRADINASRITGSPYQAAVLTGEAILAGCLVSEGTVHIRTQRVGAKTFLAQMVSEVSARLESRSRANGNERLLALTVLLATASYVFTGHLGRSISILLAAAPTALELALPMAYMPFIRQAMAEGIYFRDYEALDTLAAANAAIFDKTGTLTTAHSEIGAIELFDPAYTRETLLQITALAEQGVRHPVASAIRQEAAQVKAGPAPLAEGVVYSPGLGVRASVRGQRVLIGNARLMEQEGVDLAQTRGRTRRLAHLGLISVYVAVDGKICGVFGIRDVVKAQSKETVNQLRLAGIRDFGIISGDRTENTVQLARDLEIDLALGNLLPQDKAQFIKQFKREQPRNLIMVGDGVNDSLAMAASDLGVALGCTAYPSAACAAGVVIASDDPRKVARALRLSRRAREMVRRNTALATGLAIAGLSLSTAGLFTPVAAGLFANAGVLAVMANSMSPALRGRHRPPAVDPAMRVMRAETACASAQPVPELSNWYAAGGTWVLELLGTPGTGLSHAQRAERLQLYGKNTLQWRQRASLWELFVEPFRDFMVRLLLGASVFSALVGEFGDALIIGGIILLEASLGMIQGYRAEKSLQALKDMAAPSAVVMVDGCYQSIQAGDLVPGDLILLEAGDQVPADARLLEAEDFEVEEAGLTGESQPVRKDPLAILRPGAIPAERLNMVFMGTSVVKGRAKAVVVGTGMKTQMGLVADLLQEADEEMTPLQIQLDSLGKKITVGCLAACGLVVAIGLINGQPPLQIIRTGISLAVGAIPEGLPAVVTIAMAFGVHRMARKNMVVRKLNVVETLGSATVICTDKTGTLTKNEMTVTNIVGYSRHWQVTGEGYLPQGRFHSQGRVVDPAQDAELRQILSICTLCNNAGYDGDNGHIQGDPTEAALLVVAAKAGFPWVETRESLCREKEFPFDSDRKIMSVVCRDTRGRAVLYTKGAPGSVLERCTHVYRRGEAIALDDRTRARIEAVTTGLAGCALRVLALAYRPLPAGGFADSAEQSLILAGLVGMKDPPKPGVKQAVAKCRRAGVKVLMITGDHPATGVTIARQLDILRHGRLLTGSDIEKMSEETLGDCLERVEVCARTTPEHKLRIVRALKRNGHVVAMTGDGVNDAPAVKEADVGIAMGLSGTEVTKGASSIVLTDDNFATIVAALEEGRNVGDNIRNAVRYILPGNLGEVLAIIGSALVGRPLPLIPSQILFINLVTESISAMALGARPPDSGVLDQPPRKPDTGIISNGLQNRILVRGIFNGLTTFALFALAGNDIARGRTVAFANLVTSQVFNLLKCQGDSRWSERNPYLLPTAGASLALLLAGVYVPFLRPLFQTTPLGVMDWALLFTSSALVNKAEDLGGCVHTGERASSRKAARDRSR